jgi:hypothetical protein
MANKRTVPFQVADEALDFYEAAAGQEENYLEEIEEELRVVLISCKDSSSGNPATQILPDTNVGQDELLDAALDLISGDSDDAPLSDDTLSGLLDIARRTV